MGLSFGLVYACSCLCLLPPPPILNNCLLISFPFFNDFRPPAPTRVRIGILSRRRKRFILNEHELVEALLKMGYDVQLLPMEEMTLHEQIKVGSAGESEWWL